MKNNVLMALFAGVAVMGSASASVLTPGTTGSPDSLSLAGLTYVTSIGGPADALTYNATYTAAVYVGGNAECGVATDCLTYVYQWTDVSATGFESDPGIIQHITGSSFASVLTDVGVSTTLPTSGPPIFTSLGTVTPDAVDRSTGSGAVITFDFVGADALSPGSTSDILVIQTNAVVLLPGLTSAQDGSTVTVGAFGPSLASPEPGTILLLISGLGGVAMFARKKSRNS